MTMDMAAVGRLRRLGEVPPPSTDDRRRWLLALTRAELIALTRPHGADQDVFSDCLGFGAYRGGSDVDDDVHCSRCHRPGLMLYFWEDDHEIPRCWTCAALDHLTVCDLWEIP